MARGFQINPGIFNGVDAVSADSTHSFGRHSHDQFGIGVILRGAQKSWSGRGMVEAQAGDVITVNPNEVHDGTPLCEEGRAWRMLYFDPLVLSDPIDQLTEGRHEQVELSHPVMRDIRLASRFLALFRVQAHSDGPQSEIEGPENLLLLLASLIGYRRGTTATGASRAIELARLRIDDDPAQSLSLRELASIGGVSSFQLIRGFTRLTGMTPHAYLVQRRLQKARQMLTDGTGLADAALAAGFADQSHMTRLFVRAYGLSPGAYAAAKTGRAISFKTG